MSSRQRTRQNMWKFDECKSISLEHGTRPMKDVKCALLIILYNNSEHLLLPSISLNWIFIADLNLVADTIETTAHLFLSTQRLRNIPSVSSSISALFCVLAFRRVSLKFAQTRRDEEKKNRKRKFKDESSMFVTWFHIQCGRWWLVRLARVSKWKFYEWKIKSMQTETITNSTIGHRHDQQQHTRDSMNSTRCPNCRRLRAHANGSSAVYCIVQGR